MGKVELEHKLSVGDKIMLEATTESYLWFDFTQMHGPLSEEIANIETIITIDVVSVDEDGIVEIKLRGKETKSRAGCGDGPETTTAEQLTRTYKIKRTGKVVWSDIGKYKHRHPQNPAEDTVEWHKYIYQQVLPFTVLPGKEVGVGDLWTTVTSLKSPDGGSLEMATSSRLFALGKVGEHECAWIQSEIALPIKIEFSGGFEGYSSVSMKGVVNSREISHFAYKKGIAIGDRISADTEVIFQIDNLQAPIIEHLDDAMSATFLPRQA